MMTIESEHNVRCHMINNELAMIMYIISLLLVNGKTMPYCRATCNTAHTHRYILYMS